MKKRIEEWRDIPGFKGFYQASSLGRIRSIDRFRQVQRGNKLVTIFYKGKILNFLSKINNAGYYSVTLCDGPKQISKDVHRLICLTFNGPPSKLRPQVNHKNGNKLDNRSINLEWVSGSENIQHMMRSGRFDEHKKNMSFRSKGENNIKAKLNKKQVSQIREAIKKGIQVKALSFLYNVSGATIRNIRRNDTWN